MSRKLSDWASIAEIVGAVAIVLSLVFVGLEIRNSADQTKQNTRVNQAAVYEDLINGMNQFNLSLMNDGHLADVWLNRNDIGLSSMAAEDRSRVILMSRVRYRLYDAAYFSYRNGSLGEDQWDRFRVRICPDSRDDLWLETEDIISQEFASYLNENCSN